MPTVPDAFAQPASVRKCKFVQSACIIFIQLQRKYFEVRLHVVRYTKASPHNHCGNRWSVKDPPGGDIGKIDLMFICYRFEGPKQALKIIPTCPCHDHVEILDL